MVVSTFFFGSCLPGLERDCACCFLVFCLNLFQGRREAQYVQAYLWFILTFGHPEHKAEPQEHGRVSDGNTLVLAMFSQSARPLGLGDLCALHQTASHVLKKKDAARHTSTFVGHSSSGMFTTLYHELPHCGSMLLCLKLEVIECPVKVHKTANHFLCCGSIPCLMTRKINSHGVSRNAMQCG